jgi:hypothetical protein
MAGGVLGRDAGRARTLVGFAAFGLFWGSWGGVLPAVRAHAGVDEGTLGLALLCIGAGALVSMRPAGAVLDRHGARVLPVALAIFRGARRRRRPRARAGHARAARAAPLSASRSGGRRLPRGSPRPTLPRCPRSSPSRLCPSPARAASSSPSAAMPP